jgi:hypothetical protein
MSATRTQIYLTDDLRRRVDEFTATQGMTLAELVRTALDRYLSEEQPTSAGAALAATFGADPEANAPSRDEWDRA